ncbi:zinc-binding dehydrogenase [Nocardia puris]|uniref:quinone oxidoreductase family protein n=1 Tax=Nocardia puris TaxID=208602 RepID=UPI001893551C|nr:zinc-binding dehydrogenase [Nocardia puris]MBF6210803.1 zinc-binding dehydrogenase [Nocardia puris]MBF6364398.1 zinc-binding dehydrogenase [Nocardia puris]MBF6459327.1 zinc-binding dehydrogenase [Nocardia puris]
MRRIRYERHGGRDVLEPETAETPVPGAGELLVKVDAIGVTLPVVRDPAVLAGEIAGEVIAVGEGVTTCAPGFRVTGLCTGHAYAEYAILREDLASPIPDGASAVDAVALVRGGLVALGALDAASPQSGESALVTAAASGVGHLAVQLARVRGAKRVVAAVSDPAKGDFLRDLGVDDVIVYAEPPAEPVDYALDGVGHLAPALSALAPGGRLVAFGSGGGAVGTDDLLTDAKSIIGFQIARLAPEVYDDLRQELWQYFASGQLRPAVHAEFVLDDAGEAHAVIAGRANLGKVVLVP